MPLPQRERLRAFCEVVQFHSWARSWQFCQTSVVLPATAFHFLIDHAGNSSGSVIHLLSQGAKGEVKGETKGEIKGEGVKGESKRERQGKWPC